VNRSLRWLLAISLISVVALAGPTPADVTFAQATNAYHQTNLVSDVPGLAAVTDPNLVNPWGMSATATSPFWSANNGSGTATLYSGLGVPNARIVTIPPASSRAGAKGRPTGTVNGSGGTDFVVSSGGVSGSSNFIFSTEDGTIQGWNPNVNGTLAFITVDNLDPNTGAVYKGLAIASNGGANFLYAPNFRAGTVDVFDRTWQKVTVPGGFNDPTIPAGFAPFNTQTLGGLIYVTYAKQDVAKRDDVPGAGNGFVNVFNPDGTLVRRLASGGTLNSPWGVAIAPANYGPFSNQVLVGNFGDGRISAYSLQGTFLGQMQDAAGQPISIDGLWAIRVGNGGNGSDVNSIYFLAGPQNETHGLYGVLSVIPNVIGGRGLGINSRSDGVVVTWQPGIGQTSFQIVRLSNGVFTTVAPNLSAATTSFLDATAPTGLNCYWLFALGTSPTRTSDLLCATFSPQVVAGVPQNFTLRMNQLPVANLTWAPPVGGGQDNYLLIDLLGGTQVLPGTATSATVVVPSFDCFILQARSGNTVLGSSQALCGAPGFSNLPA
jgi:uncharacterized protein (TIGR03118 family)